MSKFPVSDFSEKTFTAQDGLELYYRDYGDPYSERTPVLCLPGLTRNSADFHRVARRIATGRRVICPDYRGRGKSAYDPNPENYIPATYLNDIRHLLTLTGIHHFVVIGTSLGGLIGMALALVIPSAVKAAVLNDIGPEIANNGRERIMHHIGTPSSPPNWEAAVAKFRALFPKLSLQTDEEWLDATRATFRVDTNGIFHCNWDLAIVKPLLAQQTLPDLWPIFHALDRVPVLGVRGELSDLLLPETFERMAAEHPNFTALTVANTGHVPSLWEPESQAAIDHFFAGL
jgi:pimeloyl-ACP methyl ester carboxylesterase